MNWFKNRKTMTKLMTAFGLMALLVGFVGYEGIRGMQATDDHLKTIHRHGIGLGHLKESQLELTKISGGLSVLNVAFKDLQALEKRIEHDHQSELVFQTAFAEYEKTLVGVAVKQEAAEVDRLFQDLRDKKERLFAAVKANEVTDANDQLKNVRGAANEVDKRMEKLSQIKYDLMTKAAEDANAAARSTMIFVIVTIIVAILLALTVGIVIARMIARPLGKAADVLKAVAAGDFTRTLDVDTKDEVGQMAAALNQAVDGMRTALQEVSLAANYAASSSQHLSAASEHLSTGAQEQASSLEETGASLEEITGTVKQNADNARRANQLAIGSCEVAEKGGQVVAEAVRSMSEINKSSNKIADIISTIDEIAFQTNLLALNAAVEAARAGEQGRGFAVVASEVRNLAQRSAAAAKEIKGLIQDSVQKVEAGSLLVNKSGETLNEIVGSVKRVTDIIAEIAAASQEQTAGIDQVNKAVTQMDQVTQANAAQTEELSSTAQALAAQAEQLQALVARFKLDDGAASARTAAVSDPPAPPPVAKTTAVKSAAKPLAVKAKPRGEPVLAGTHAHAANGGGAAAAKDDGFEEF